MSGHGGYRVRSGRKPILTAPQQLAISSWCEHQWRQLAEKRALTAYQAKTQGIRAAQDRTALVPLRSRKGKNLSEIREDIDNAVSKRTGGLKRYTTIPVKRPRNQRAKIIRAGIARCWKEYAVHVKPRLIDSYWDKHRRELRRYILISAP
jgi:hypothetical protein